MMTETAQLYDNTISLAKDVQRALIKSLNIPPWKIFMQENREKYYDHENPHSGNSFLNEVFDLMRSLNETAVSDPAIGARYEGDKNFLHTLNSIADTISETLSGRPFVYLELGPEPAKTKHLLERLRRNGCSPALYTCVDINPASAEEMHRAISDVMPADKIRCLTKAFEDLKREDVAIGDAPVFSTMLGFQEGNEHPVKTGQFLKKILRPDDYILSEMQLFDPDDPDVCLDFYRDARMRRFSKLALLRAFPDAESEYEAHIVPVDLATDEAVRACVIGERIREPQDLAGSFFVTNYCLKYTLSQFRQARERHAPFKVIAEDGTGDGSIAFQLAVLRRPGEGPGDQKANP